MLDYEVLSNIVFKSVDSSKDIASVQAKEISESPPETTPDAVQHHQHLSFAEAPVVSRFVPFSTIHTPSNPTTAAPGYRAQQTATHLSILFDAANVVRDSVTVDIDREIDSGGFTQACLR